MTSRKLRFAIFGNTYQPKKSASIQKLLACLSARRAEVCIEREFYCFLTDDQHLPVDGVSVFDPSDFNADFVKSLNHAAHQSIILNNSRFSNFNNKIVCWKIKLL